MNKKYIVKLSEVDRKTIGDILHNPKTTKTFRNRSNILLMADESQGTALTHKDIAMRCGVNVVTVYKTVKSYVQTGIEATLHFTPRAKPSNPPKITGETEARIIALACGPAPEGYARWTVRLLTQKIIELEIVDSVCPETVRSTLKKLDLNLI